MNTHASKMGRMARNIPKKYSPEEIKRRTYRLKKARSKRWKYCKREINALKETIDALIETGIGE
jgi:hypothetical protein